MSRILCTGAAGFLGSHIAELLCKNNNVFVLDDLSGGYMTNVPVGAKFVRGNITDTSFVNDLFDCKKFDYVFHLAAYAAEGLSHFIKHFNYTNNLLGSINLINASVNHGVKCFVFTSSIAVYGTQPCPMTEETPTVPEDSYGIAKLAVEQELKISHEMFGLNYITFRPHNVYGERQNIGDPYRNVIGIWMNQILNDEPMTIFGDGFQGRAFSYVGDVAPIIAYSIDYREAYNQTFNVGSDEAHSVSRLSSLVASAMMADPIVKHLPARNEVRYAYASHEKVKKMFGEYGRHTDIEEGLENMATWVKKHGARQGKKFDNLEITKNLPEAWK